MWRDRFESNKFIEDVDRLWNQVEPLYNSLHKHAMIKLQEKYGKVLDMSDGLIPAHIFGKFIF